VTRILRDITVGAPGARERLLGLVYGELKLIARARLARFRQGSGEGPAPRPTELVHEAYLRLFAGETLSWSDRQHFYATAAKAMLQCLLDNAPRAHRVKRGYGRVQSLVWDPPDDLRDPDAILSLNEAIERLERRNPVAAQVVRYKYLLGMTEDEICRELSVSRKTVNNKWRFAQAWLKRRLSPAAP
jgi:RNA polymerase sigma factor (TIGR02999 family)